MKKSKDSKNKEKTIKKVDINNAQIVKETSNTKKEKKRKKRKINNKRIGFINRIQKFVRNNIFDIIMAVLSIIALIIGTVAIDFKKAFIIVFAIDVFIWIIPVVFFIGNKSKRKIKRRSIIQIGLWCIIAGLLACIGFALFIMIKSPKFNPANLYSKESTVIYDKDGNVAAKIGSQRREKVSYEELPEILIDAIIATEDSQFFEHNGFNPARFLKASVSQILGNGGGGASTITMQVSKNTFTSFESGGIDGIIRKFTDIYLSIFKIEKTYTKEEILEFYVNSYYMGGDAWGVEQACQTYFGKSVGEINLSEAALIAGLFKGGYAYDPYIFPEESEYRRKIVLELMKRHGYITDDEAKMAAKLTVDDIIITDRKTESYQAFIDTLVEEIKNKTGKNPYSVPMEIYSTLDTSKQKHINKIMSGEIYKWENDNVQAGIMVTNTNTGEIVAVGSGRNRKGIGTFNYATMINNQVGSTAKPLYDYGPAIEYNNMSTAEPIADEPHGYSSGVGIKNWDDRFEGLMTARSALKSSRNIPALKTFQKVKNSNIKKFVTGLGLNPQLENGMIFESHSLGGYNGESPLTMASAYAAFANGGTYIEPHSFTKIIYRDTNEEYINTYEKRKVMSEATAYMVTSMLIDTAVYTTGNNRVNGIQYANKTGTTNFDNSTKSLYGLPYDAVKDLWCVGYSRDFAVAVWYGYDKTTSKNYSISRNQNANLFKAAIKGALSGTKNFSVPSSVSAVVIEKNNAEIKLPSENTPDNMRVTEYFKSGTEPTEISNRFANLPNVTGLNGHRDNSFISLNWTEINTPQELNREALTNEFKKVFSNESHLSDFVNKRLNENNELLGQIEYEVYIKDNDGTYQLIGKTTDNHFEYKPSNLSNGILNFKVVSTYTNFRNAPSSGAEFEISINDIESIITSNINGLETIELMIGDTYEEPIKPVVVQDNMIDVTNESIILSTITDENNNIINNINTSDTGIYKITYNVSYKNYRNTLVKTITVQ